MALTLSDSTVAEVERILSATNAFDVLRVSATHCTKEAVNESFNTLMAPFLKATRDVKAMQVREKLKAAKSILMDDKLRSVEAGKVQKKVTIAAHERQELQAVEERTKLLELRAANILATMEAMDTVLPAAPAAAGGDG